MRPTGALLRPPAFAPWAAALALALAACGGGRDGARGAASGESAGALGRIEERTLSQRPLLSVVERSGDPEGALALASLASGPPELHAELGEVLRARLAKAGFDAALSAHGVGFELALLADGPERARAALTALMAALTRPITAPEAPEPSTPSAPPASSNAVARCSAELPYGSGRYRAAELERERQAAFAADRAAFAVVGSAELVRAASDALEQGPSWPTLGLIRSPWPEHDTVEVERSAAAGELSVAFRVREPDRAIGASSALGSPEGALALRLSVLGTGIELGGVAATARPEGACLRVDARFDASPGPDAKLLARAVRTIEQEARLALGASDYAGELEARALRPTDPRRAARAAAYRALVEQAPQKLPERRAVLVRAPGASLRSEELEAALGASDARLPFEAKLRVEAGQAGFWALASVPCAANTERSEAAGAGALFLRAAALGGSRDPDLRLEPWVGAGGIGLVGYATQRRGESAAALGRRLGDALGRAFIAPPASIDVAAARESLEAALGSKPRPGFEALLEALTPTHAAVLAPLGTFRALDGASRESVLARQRELLRLPHRIAVLSPTNESDASALVASASRWLESGETLRSSPCGLDVATPAPSDILLTATGDEPEGSYLGFRVAPELDAELGLLAELLNASNGLLARALSDGEVVGAARALPLGTRAARALVIQFRAFDGKEQEALARLKALFERLASGTAIPEPELETALRQSRARHHGAALDPRYRLITLHDGEAPAPADETAFRKLLLALRPESAIFAHPAARGAEKSPATR